VFRFSSTLAAQFFQDQNTPPRRRGRRTEFLRSGEARCAVRREVPEGFTDAILQSDTMDNVDADVLAAVYNPNHPGFINAYMTGAPHKDLR